MREYRPIPYPTEPLGYLGLYVKLPHTNILCRVTWIAGTRIGYGRPLRFVPIDSIERVYVRL